VKHSSTKRRIDFMHAQRAAEWTVARLYMPPSGAFLDYGAGTGIMAHLAEAQFSPVIAIDVEASNYRSWAMRPVLHYDGHHLPFPPASFDVVFSSHAILYGDPAEVHAELARVLRPGGVAVHVVPTAAARVVAAAGHFVTLPFRALRALTTSGQTPPGKGAASTGKTAAARGAVERLLPAALNPSNSFREEVSQFRVPSWRRSFERLGWVVVAEAPTGTFGSSRNMVRGVFPQACRRLAAQLLGSHSHVFVLMRPEDAQARSRQPAAQPSRK
jgi:SAM-dependent methyltransferase